MPISGIFTQGSIVIISDCQSVDIAKVSSMKATTSSLIIKTIAPLSKKYQTNAEVSLLEANSYFIQETDRVNQNGKTIYALSVMTVDGEVEEIVENVNDFKIRFFCEENNRVVEKTVNQLNPTLTILGATMKLEFSLDNLDENKTWTKFIAL